MVARSVKFRYGSLYAVIEEDYRVAMIDADIRFVPQFLQRITDKRTGWARDWAAHMKQQAEVKKSVAGD